MAIRKKKILFVGFANSIHVARWTKQIISQNWEVHLFPSIETGFIHPDFKGVIIHHTLYNYKKLDLKHNKIQGIPIFSKKLTSLGTRILNKRLKNFRVWKLVQLIKKLKPDIIHSLEMQSAGYLVLEAKKQMKDNFPKWIATNWGSDIYLFSKLAEHRLKIKEVLSEADYYSCECKRDVKLARDFGFRGKILPVLPSSGGYDFNQIKNLRQKDSVLDRKVIVLKGYQGVFGRALVGVAALALCKRLLIGYTLVVYSVSAESGVELAARILAESIGIELIIVPPETPHEQILSFHGQARLSISLSISDGISTSLLEAMIMGSFPIHSNTSGAKEWITNLKTGIIVPPEDPNQIAKAITRALTDDQLVNYAVLKNLQISQKKLAYQKIKQRVVKMYKGVFNNEI